MTLFFNSLTASGLRESIITLTCVPVLLNFFAFTMLVLKNILQFLIKTNIITLLSAWHGEEHCNETFRRRVSKKLSLSAFSSCLNFSANKKFFCSEFTFDFYWQVCFGAYNTSFPWCYLDFGVLGISLTSDESDKRICYSKFSACWDNAVYLHKQMRCLRRQCHMFLSKLIIA